MLVFIRSSWTQSIVLIWTFVRISSPILFSAAVVLCAKVNCNPSLTSPYIHAFVTGFGDRLLNEVKKLALKDIKIKIYAPPERKYSTWIGGSILAGLNTFKKVFQI